MVKETGLHNLDLSKTSFLRKSLFTQHLILKNDLHERGFERWVFHPGMLFRAQDKWWGDQEKRDKPHEGLDLLLYRDRCNQTRCLEKNARIPVLYDGVTVGIINDFLGKSIIVKHHITSGVNILMYTFYGHTIPQNRLHLGSIVEEGDIIATLSGVGNTKSGMFPHIHISLGWASRAISPDKLNWETLDALDTLTLLDPLPVIA